MTHILILPTRHYAEGMFLKENDASREKARRGAFSRHLAWLVWRESLASFPLILQAWLINLLSRL